MAMTISQAEFVKNILENELEQYDIEVREEYSGRSMYGASVPAFVANDDSAIVMIGVAWGIAYQRWMDGDDDASAVDGDWDDVARNVPTRTDNMGRGVVIY